MSEKSIAQKMMMKPGRRVLLVNAPQGYEALLALPEGTTRVCGPEGETDIIQVFFHNRQEMEAGLEGLKARLGRDGALWVTYHKGTSKIKTDIHRDSIAAYGQSLGLQPVAIVAIDEDWAALRFKVTA